MLLIFDIITADITSMRMQPFQIFKCDRILLLSKPVSNQYRISLLKYFGVISVIELWLYVASKLDNTCYALSLAVTKFTSADFRLAKIRRLNRVTVRVARGSSKLSHNVAIYQIFISSHRNTRLYRQLSFLHFSSTCSLYCGVRDANLSFSRSLIRCRYQS